MSRFAEGTSVSVERSKGEIERLLVRHGATQFANGWDHLAAMLGFRLQGRTIRFVLPLPDPYADEFTKTPAGRRKRSDADRERAWEQACRARWRALLLVIKAKLEAVACGISTIEDEFLAWTVLPGGKTVGQLVAPQIAKQLEGGKAGPLLLTEGVA